MKGIHTTFALALLTLASVSAYADCVYPKTPEAAPNGSTATEAEMVAGMQVFKKYQDDVNAYLTCLDLDAKTRSATAGDNAQQAKDIKEMAAKKHNSAIDELSARADAFNQQLRAFKAKQKS
ncbi:MAG: hypothetical protein H7Y02_00875 [Candidatus Obscuribacterales bacterium]|nr:hypothetical protein [Steroidobacteraceae bacterium]